MTYPSERYHPGGNFEPIEQEEAPEWMTALEGQINTLLNLPDHWDGGHAQPITRYTMATLLDVLDKLSVSSDQLPQLVPLSSGGVQAKWHYNNYKIEVVVDTDGRLSAYAAYDNGDYDIDVSEVEAFEEDIIQHLVTSLQQLRQR